jgi:hypothetical protein
MCCPGEKDSRFALAVLECKERPGAKVLAPVLLHTRNLVSVKAKLVSALVERPLNVSG